MSVKVGKRAPNFVLYDTERRPRSLTEFLGKKVVVAFFPGAFTAVCTREVCAFRDKLGKLRALNAEVLGISVDPPFVLKAWAEQNRIPFPLLSDYGRKVVGKWGVALKDLAGLKDYTSCTRAVFILDTQGVVRYAWVGRTEEEPNYEEIALVLARIH